VGERERRGEMEREGGREREREREGGMEREREEEGEIVCVRAYQEKWSV